VKDEEKRQHMEGVGLKIEISDNRDLEITNKRQEEGK
jgi:hypothetical protein